MFRAARLMRDDIHPFIGSEGGGRVGGGGGAGNRANTCLDWGILC